MRLYSTDLASPLNSFAISTRSRTSFRKTSDSSKADQWLALSIGNSRLHWAWFADNVLQSSWDTSHLDAFAIQRLIINQFNFHRCHLLDTSVMLPQWDNMPDLWMISVVPHQTQFWQQYLRLHLLTLQDIPLEGAYSTLGKDRAIAAWGAVQLCGGAALVIDCGTALTLTGADATGHLMGGAILPGLRLQLQSLGQSTAALPTLMPESISLPSRWAMNTAESISSGVLYSIASSINSYIQDWLIRFPSSPIFITGGDSVFIANLIREHLPHLSSQLRLEPDLAFLGINALRQEQLAQRDADRIKC